MANSKCSHHKANETSQQLSVQQMFHRRCAAEKWKCGIVAHFLNNRRNIKIKTSSKIHFWHENFIFLVVVNLNKIIKII